MGNENNEINPHGNKKFQPGDIVRVKEVVHGGKFPAGTIGKVVELYGEDGYVVASKDDTWHYCDCELEAGDWDETASEFKVGDKVRVALLCGIESDDHPVGTVCEITKVFSDHYEVESVDTRSNWWFSDHELVKA